MSKPLSLLSFVFVTLSGSGLVHAAANPPPLDNITSVPPVTRVIRRRRIRR